MCAHTWAPIKICTHMLVHETPHTRNYTHKAHRCTLIHTKMHKCMPPTHAHQTHTLAFSLSPPLCAPGRPGAQESHLEAGQGAPAAGKRPRVSVCRGLGLSAVCVGLQGGRFWATCFTGCLQVAVGLPSPLQPPSQRGPPPSCPHPGHAAQALGTCLRLPGSKQAEGPSRDICLSVSWASVSQTVTQRGGFWGCPASCTALSLPVFCTKSPSPRRD